MREAIVIGGGPAGLSAALGFLSRDVTPTVLEQRPRWQARVCGAFLSPEAVRHLEELDLLSALRARGAVPVTETVVTGSDGRTAAIPIGQQGTPGLAVARFDLEQTLTEAVRMRGGRVLAGVRVIAHVRTRTGWVVDARPTATAARIVGGLKASDFSTLIDGREGRRLRFEAPFLALADGRFSSAADRARQPRRRGWYGWNATFVNTRQAPGTLSLHFYDGGYVGALTFANGETNICGLSVRSTKGERSWEHIFEEAVERQPALRALLSESRRMSPWNGVGPLPFCRTMRTGRGEILAGDAAAVGDPFMGEGNGRALAAGPLIADAMDAGRNDPERVQRAYREKWKRAYRPRFWIGAAARIVLAYPPLLNMGMSTLLKRPAALRRATPFFHVGASRRRIL